MSASGITRRELVRRGGLLSLLPALLRGGAAAAEPAATAPAAAAGAGLRLGPEIYQSIGVRPFVNARGTYTILTGSTLLPEVRAAMGDASRHYVHLDELAEAVGAAPRRADAGRVGHGHERLLRRAHARDRGLRHRRQPGPARAPARPARVSEGRVHHPEALAQRLRRGGARRGRARGRGRDGRGAGGGLRPAHGARLHPRRARTRTRGRSARRRSARPRRSAACRCWWTRRPRS